MSAEQVEEIEAGSPFVGFRTFADDTPRDVGDALQPARPSLTTTTASPELDAGGWQDLRLPAYGQERAMGASQRRRGLSAALITIGLAGGAVAVVLGLGASRKPVEQGPMAASVPTIPITVADRVATPAVPVVDPPATRSSPSVTERQAVSPPVVLSDATPAPAARPSSIPVIAAPPPVARTPQIALAAPHAEPAQPVPEPRSASAEKCVSALTRAEQLVCADPELAAADQQMVHAYRAAIAAGAPERMLAREQLDWLHARDDASRRSRQAVANLYDLRISDLAEWLNDDAPADPH
jgi:uncharacterized protein YecT (DUF1311 family)